MHRIARSFVIGLSLALVACPEPPPPLDLSDLRRINEPAPATPGKLTPFKRPAPGSADRGDFVMITALNRLPGNKVGTSRVAKVLEKSGIVAELIRILNDNVVLPQDVKVLSKACGKVDAFYDPGIVQITLCDELFEMLEGLFQGLEQRQFEEAVLGATAFIFLHEAAHALVHQLRLRVYASEEDVADALATWIAVNTDAGLAFAGVDAFALLADRNAPAFWDEHAPDAKRAYNIMCWVHGSNPSTHAWMVRPDILPAERAARCPGEYAQLVDTIDRDLALHLKR